MRTHALARQALIATLTFGGFFLLGYGGIFIWGGNSHSSCPIWPATAFGFVMLIRLSRSRGDDAALLSAMLAAGLIANRLGGEAPLLALGFSLINMLDVLAGLVAFRRLRL
jgi:ABC-type Co2+ transport system permease subunit